MHDELWNRAARLLSASSSVPTVRNMPVRQLVRFIKAVKRADSFEALAEKHKQTILQAERELDLKQAHKAPDRQEPL